MRLVLDCKTLFARIIIVFRAAYSAFRFTLDFIVLVLLCDALMIVKLLQILSLIAQTMIWSVLVCLIDHVMPSKQQ